MTPPPLEHLLTSDDVCSCCAWDVTSPTAAVRLAAASTHPGPVRGDRVDVDGIPGLVTAVDTDHVHVLTDDGVQAELDPNRVIVLTPALKPPTHRRLSRLID
ncbi:hypothetical protein [Actinokineospora enzanensis]|uniref:hypothetical protein n=1 Tax=Actinokineospora enzanensis TaxID=155975 RepID=UPI00035E58ED|nr:hypothetical protein [Actinokineospora enzanensis]